MLLRGLLAMTFMAACCPAWAQGSIEWLKAAPKGCKVGWFNPHPQASRIVSAIWNGPCPQGVARGHGTFEIDEKFEEAYGNRRLTWTGEGDLDNGLLNGGAFAVAGENRMEGHFRDGLLNGRGITTELSGTWRYHYDGEFAHGKENGWGVQNVEEDLKGRKWTLHYEGQWQDGARSGRGKELETVSGCSTQVRYEGEWRDGKFNGRGTLNAADGRTYTGVWQDNRMGDIGTALAFGAPKRLPELRDVCGLKG